MMKLFYSPTSPYARKARMVIMEKGLTDRVEVVATAPYDRPAELVAANPLVKVPALLTDDGQALYDSPVICEYLDSLTPETPLIPASGPARWTVLRRAALADGILDAAYNAVMESRRADGMISQAFITAQTEKVANGLDAIEAGDAADLSADRPGMAEIAIAVAIGYVQFRLPELGSLENRPKLDAWYAAFSKRPSVQETRPDL